MTPRIVAAVTVTPGSGKPRESQLTIDGQQVSSERGFGGQPRHSNSSFA